MHPILLFHTNVSPTVININYLLPTSLWGEKDWATHQEQSETQENLKKLTLRISNYAYETNKQATVCCNILPALCNFFRQ
jgi:hypothetical protein